ncbi:MAG TPA: hypothetical protein VEI83_16090 [Acidimicrobiales bacterium]|nr:hypothetical protein [Acidimicrobiales bacterium]
MIDQFEATPAIDAGERAAKVRARHITFWLTATAFLVVVTGMAYSLWWPAIVQGHSWYWLYPGDIWGTVRAAHWIGWGDLSFVYSSSTGLVTLPGFHLLLTPVVMLSSALGLSETAPGFLPVPEPTAWLLIGPVVLACAGVALFGADALARALDVPLGRRRLLALAVGCSVWPTLQLWGHPEDVVALGLIAFALAAAIDERWTAAGWLLGGALASQLYAAALIPLLIGIAGRRRAFPLLARAAILPGFLFVAVAVPNPHASLHALLQQPNFPRVDRPTPWVALAPSLGHGAVAAGPGRIVGVAVAVGIGFVAMRRRQDPMLVVWLAALALSTRCLFESVMDPYYVMPGIVVAFVVASKEHWLRFALALAAGAAVTVLTYSRTGEWRYWVQMAGVILLMTVVTMPSWGGTGVEPARRNVQGHEDPSLTGDRVHAGVGGEARSAGVACRNGVVQLSTDDAAQLA